MSITYATIAERYLAERAVSAHYAGCVRRIAKRCPGVTVEQLNRYLAARLNNAAGTTVKFERTILLSLWRWAYDRGLMDIAPRGVAKLKARRKPTKAWSIEQIRAAIAATRELDGRRLKSGAEWKGGSHALEHKRRKRNHSWVAIRCRGDTSFSVGRTRSRCRLRGQPER